MRTGAAPSRLLDSSLTSQSWDSLIGRLPYPRPSAISLGLTSLFATFVTSLRACEPRFDDASAHIPSPFTAQRECPLLLHMPVVA